MRAVADALEDRRVAIAVPAGRAVGDEDQVELAALGGLRQLAIVVDVVAGIGLRIRMPPGGDVVAGRHDEGAEPDLAVVFAHRRPRHVRSARLLDPADVINVH